MTIARKSVTTVIIILVSIGMFSPGFAKDLPEDFFFKWTPNPYKLDETIYPYYDTSQATIVERKAAEIKTKYVDPAQRAFSHDDWAEASRLQEQAVAAWRALPKGTYRNDGLRDALRKNSGFYSLQKRWDKVEESYREIAGLYNDMHYMDAGLEIASACVKQKKYDEAETVLIQLIKDGVTRDNYQCTVQLSKVYEEEGKVSEAEKVFRDLLDNAKEHPHDRAILRAVWSDYAAFLVRIHEPAEAAKFEKLLTDKHCPVCGSEKDVQRIVYGHPGTLLPWVPNTRQGQIVQNSAISGQPSESDLTGASREPDVKLGGCMISSGSPQWFCPRDNTYF